MEAGLKQEYTDQEAEKYRLMEEIHDLGDLIAKNKSEGRYFEEETMRNLQKKEEYSSLAKKYADKIKESEEVLKPMSKELETVQEAEIAVDCQIEMEKYDIEVLRKEFKELEEREKNSQDDCKRVLKRKEEGHDR